MIWEWVRALEQSDLGEPANLTVTGTRHLSASWSSRKLEPLAAVKLHPVKAGRKRLVATVWDGGGRKMVTCKSPQELQRALAAYLETVRMMGIIGLIASSK